MSATTGVLDETGKVQEHCFQIGDDPRAVRPVEVAAPVSQSAPVARPAQRAPIAAPSGPIPTSQILRQLRERLRVVEREIKLRKDLESERAQLKRLIGAAKSEQDNVRRLRSAG